MYYFVECDFFYIFTNRGFRFDVICKMFLHFYKSRVNKPLLCYTCRLSLSTLVCSVFVWRMYSTWLFFSPLHNHSVLIRPCLSQSIWACDFFYCGNPTLYTVWLHVSSVRCQNKLAREMPWPAASVEIIGLLWFRNDSSHRPWPLRSYNDSEMIRVIGRGRWDHTMIQKWFES